MDIARDDDLNADVAIAVCTEWERAQGAEELNLADLIRGQTTSTHDDGVPRVNRVGRQRN